VADIDLDGDLDIVLGHKMGGDTIIQRFILKK